MNSDEMSIGMICPLPLLHFDPPHFSTCEKCNKTVPYQLPEYDGKRLCGTCCGKPNGFLWDALSANGLLRKNKNLIEELVRESPGRYTLEMGGTYYWIVKWRKGGYSLIEADYEDNYKWVKGGMKIHNGHQAIVDIMVSEAPEDVSWFRPEDLLKYRR